MMRWVISETENYKRRNGKSRIKKYQSWKDSKKEGI